MWWVVLGMNVLLFGKCVACWMCCWGLVDVLFGELVDMLFVLLGACGCVVWGTCGYVVWGKVDG